MLETFNVRSPIPVFVVVVSALMVGCAAPAPTRWTKDGASEEDFRRDMLTCRQYGMQSAVANGLGGNMFIELFIRNEARSCMRDLGYRDG